MESRTSTMQNLSMQRRHFQMIASVMLTCKPCRTEHEEAIRQWGETCKQMSDSLASTNPGFDRARFLAACGME